MAVIPTMVGAASVAQARAGHAVAHRVNAAQSSSWTIVRIPGAKGRISRALQPAGDVNRLYVESGGVFLSSNAGRTWRRVAKKPTHILALSPTFSKDHTILGSRGAKLLITVDDFRHVHGVKLKGVSSFTTAVFSTTYASDETIFASCSHCRRLAVTRNGGRTWASSALPKTAAGVFDLLPSPHFAQDHTLYATLSVKKVGSLPARSTDGGKTWRFLAGTGAGSQTLAGVTLSVPDQLAVRPDGSLLAADPNGTVDRSTDGGATWQALTAGLVRPHYLERTFRAVYTSEDGSVALAPAGGVTHLSLDGGAHWLRLAVEPAPGLVAPALVRPGVFAVGSALFAIDGRGRLEELRLVASASPSLPTASGATAIPIDSTTFTDGTWNYRFQYAGLWPDESLLISTYFCEAVVGGTCPPQPPHRPGWQQVFSGSANDAGTLDQPLTMLYVPPAAGTFVSQVGGVQSGNVNISLPHGDNTLRKSDDADSAAQAYLLSHAPLSSFARTPLQYHRLEPLSMYDPPTAAPVQEAKVGLAAVERAQHVKATALVWVEGYGTATNPHDCAETGVGSGTQVLEVYLSSSESTPEDAAVLGVQGYGKCAG